jgi:hypothetical protein
MLILSSTDYKIAKIILTGFFLLLLFVLLTVYIVDGIRKLKQPRISTIVRINFTDWLSFNTNSHIVGIYQILAGVLSFIAILFLIFTEL